MRFSVLCGVLSFRFCGKQRIFISVPKRGKEAEFFEQWIPKGENSSFIN